VADLPDSIAALAAQLDGDAEFLPDAELFHSPEVFTAERERIFVRPSIAIDHVSRLAEDGRYVRCDAAGRSTLVTRDADGALHALRNGCLYAGYPICDAEEGPGERVVGAPLARSASSSRGATGRPSCRLSRNAPGTPISGSSR
jgi:hypothetical protein